LFLSCSSSLSFIFNPLDIDEVIKETDEFLFNNEISLKLSGLIINGGLSITSNYESITSYKRLPLNISDKYNIIVIEFDKINIFDFFKDSTYCKILEYHSGNAFNSFLKELSLKSLYDANYTFAFQAGFIDGEINDIKKFLNSLKINYVAFNFLSRGLNCLVKKEETEKVLNSLQEIIAKENIYVFNINNIGIFKEEFNF